MTQRDFDIWLHGFPRETREAPPQAISRVFGIPVQAAEALVATLPRVVKRDASADQAERLVHALEAIGGLAEAIPTRVVPAPVLVVGQQPLNVRPETIVRHAPRAGVQRGPLADGPASNATLKIGTHELSAYYAAAAVAPEVVAVAPSKPPVASPESTLVDAEPPRWSDDELARAHARGHQTAIQTAPNAPAEPRGRWDDLELMPPELSPPISLAPPAPSSTSDVLGGTGSSIEIMRNDHRLLKEVGQGSIPLTPLSSHPPPASDTSWITLTPHPVVPPGSEPPGAWKNPMALPPRDVPLRSVGMRTAAERMRALKPRSMRPPSMMPVVTEQPTIVDAFMMLSRGDFRGATQASPTLSFALILTGVTLAFALAYAAG